MIRTPDHQDRPCDKGLLVVIAFVLGVIAVGQMSNRAEAQGEGCGSASNPCYVKVLNY